MRRNSAGRVTGGTHAWAAAVSLQLSGGSIVFDFLMEGGERREVGLPASQIAICRSGRLFHVSMPPWLARDRGLETAESVRPEGDEFTEIFAGGVWKERRL